MRKTVLYAPRLVGDIDLGLEPTRIGADGNKRWSRAVWPGGKLPGQSEQGLYEYGSTQKYRVGTRLVVDERTFRYARVGTQTASGATNGLRRGLTIVSENCLTEVALAGIITCNSGEYTVKLDMSAAVDCWGAAVTVAENEYENGYFTLFDSSYGVYWGCKILSNSAEDGSGYVTFYLEAALPKTAGGTDRANVCQNPWWRINIPNNATNGPWSPAVGVIVNHNKKAVANTLITDGDYLWVQTWGPCPGMIMGRGYGIESMERMLRVHVDGTAIMGAQYGTYLDEQPLGFFMNCNYNGGAPYDMSHPYIPVVFLTISP